MLDQSMGVKKSYDKISQLVITQKIPKNLLSSDLESEIITNKGKINSFIVPHKPKFKRSMSPPSMIYRSKRNTKSKFQFGRSRKHK